MQLNTVDITTVLVTNTEDYRALKDRIEELIQAGYLAQFDKRPDNHQAGPRPGGHQEEQHRN